MNIFGIIFVFCTLKELRAQNYSTPDYTSLRLIVDNLSKTLESTHNLTSPLPIPPDSLYYGYSQFWYFNYYATSFASTIDNITMILSNILGNFSAASTDIDNFPHIFLRIQKQIQIFNNGSYGFPVWYAEKTFNEILNEYSVQLNNIAGFLSSTMNSVSQLKSGNFTINSKNALKYLPSPLMVEIWLQKLEKLTNKYVKFVDIIVKDMHKAYSLFKSSDMTFVAIEKQANTSVSSLSIDLNMTRVIINGAFDGYKIDLNSIYDNYLTLFPKNLIENPQFQNVFLLNDTIRKITFDESVTQLKKKIKTIVENNYTNTAISIIKYYHQKELSAYVINPRANIFTQYQKNITTLSCSSTMLHNSELALKKYGGPSALFNCTARSSYEIFFEVVKQVTTNIIADANSYYSTMEQCLKVLSDMLDDVDLLEQCINSNGISVIQFASSIQDQHTEMAQHVEYYTSYNNNQILTCLREQTKQLLKIFGSIYKETVNCYNSTIINVG